MSTFCGANPCPIIVNSSCVFYEGPNLICLGIYTNETLTSVLQKVNTALCNVVGLDGTSGTSGTSGINGTFGTSGSSGTNGTSGSTGKNGSSGTTGTSGFSGDQYRTVSTTCFTLGDTGTIFVAPGLAYTAAQSIVISYDAFNYQICLVISYNAITGELVFDVPSVVVGTPAEYCQWDVNLNGAAGGDGSDGTSGSSGSSGTSCLSANIVNDSGDTNLNVIYIECNGVYENYYISPGVTIDICYQSGSLELIGGPYTVTENGLCNGTSGTSGQSCNLWSIENTSNVDTGLDFDPCVKGEPTFIIIPAGQTVTVCAIEIYIKAEGLSGSIIGICSGTSGTSGAPGGASCPDHTKIAAVSGVITSSSYNTPILDDLFIGNNPLGWSYGVYGVRPTFDGFGNIISIPAKDANCGIVLPIDLNEKDTVKISGIAYMPDRDNVDKPVFYITVSHFNCSEVDLNVGSVKTFTTIPVSTYPIPDKGWKVCFSETISLTSVLPADETFFVVGIGAGSDSGDTFDVRFSYSLDVTQVCLDGGNNLFIRNCCDPAYSEVIINNLVPVGSSFSDGDGNCWTVESETTNAVTAIRGFKDQFATCNDCIAAHQCPSNFDIESCCGGNQQVFSAALIGVNVGDTFVDTNGFCWSAISETGAPITNVVEVGTVYPATDCRSETCINANTCPTPVGLKACCHDLGGTTTLELLQASLPGLQIDDVFVDTFGMCWTIRGGLVGEPFPNMNFIIPITRYGVEDQGCKDCAMVNPCSNIPLYYQVQNCCTEEIETILLTPDYSVDLVLTLEHTTGAGCYRVLSWSNIGTATITLVNISAVSDKCDECKKAIKEAYGQYCGVNQMCCTSWINSAKPESIIYVTGYLCDGTWVVDQPLGFRETICMAQIWHQTNELGTVLEKNGPCCFDVYNPSTSDTIELVVTSCESGSGYGIQIPPQTYGSTILGTCITCVNDNKYNSILEYVSTCNLPNKFEFIPDTSPTWSDNTSGYTLYDQGWNWNSTGQGNTATQINFNNFYIPFWYGGSPDYTFWYATYGYIFGASYGSTYYGNTYLSVYDLYLNPGEGLYDGTTQNLWYKYEGGPAKWKTSLLVFSGLVSYPSQPYSYVMNLYSDGLYQYMEVYVKSNIADASGPSGLDETPSTLSQVWRSDANGYGWTYLGFGSVV